MESFLKKIFTGKKDDEVHSEFIKFSKGVFDNRYLLEGKKQADRYSVKTSAELANFLVRKCLEKVNGKVAIKGIIVSTLDLRKEKGQLFEPDEKIKQFMGIKQLIVNTTLEPQKVLDVMDKYPKAFFALSFKTDNFELKIKEKAPKSAKPSNKGDAEPKAEFCSLKTKDMDIISDLFFDFPMFKEIKIKHTIQINEIILPRGEKDPVKIRALAIRKGKMIRKIIVDGKNATEEKDFEA